MNNLPRVVTRYADALIEQCQIVEGRSHHAVMIDEEHCNGCMGCFDHQLQGSIPRETNDYNYSKAYVTNKNPAIARVSRPYSQPASINDRL